MHYFYEEGIEEKKLKDSRVIIRSKDSHCLWDPEVYSLKHHKWLLDYDFGASLIRGSTFVKEITKNDADNRILEMESKNR